MKKHIIISILIIIIIATAIGVFLYPKNQSYALKQMKNYENDVIFVLLNDTQEIKKDIDVSSWKQFKDEDLGVQFKYPSNVHISSNEKYAKNYKEDMQKELSVDLKGAGIDIEFFDETNNRLGFLVLGSLSSYNEYLSNITINLSQEEIKKQIEARNTWKIDRRNNLKKNELVGFVKNGKDIFPWTVIDAGYKDIHSMSDILWYDERRDIFKNIEIRIFGFNQESQELLYGILETLTLK